MAVVELGGSQVPKFILFYLILSPRECTRVWVGWFERCSGSEFRSAQEWMWCRQTNDGLCFLLHGFSGPYGSLNKIHMFMKIWNVLTLSSSSTSTGSACVDKYCLLLIWFSSISVGGGGMGRGGGGFVITFLILRSSLFVYMKRHTCCYAPYSSKYIFATRFTLRLKTPCSPKHTNIYCMAKEQFANIWGKNRLQLLATKLNNWR